MSRENIEALRAGYEALGRGDLGAALADFHPDVRVEDHEWSLASPVARRGHEGFLEIFAAVNEGFEDVLYVAEEFEVAGDRVLVKARRTGRGSASGVMVEERQFHVFDFKEGQIVRFRSFLSEEKAAEALGSSRE